MGLYSIPTNPLFGHFGRKDWPGSLSVSKRRKVFFSFHFDDVMRVNVVRNAWKFHRPESLLTPGFYDSSLWERRQREGDESLKQLIREGVDHTSAVCVLIGRDTWARRWVRYEIARAVIDGRGLLGIHINRIRHHSTKRRSNSDAILLSFWPLVKFKKPGLLRPNTIYLNVISWIGGCATKTTQAR
jgi:Thoeris protein ThsB, TIR-like domain